MKETDRVMITGSSGYVGSILGDGLFKRGFKLSLYDKRSGYDILDDKKLREAMEPCDFVIHLAGLRGPDCDFNNELPDYRINLELAKRVTEAAVATEVRRLVFASSGAVYGTRKISKTEIDIIKAEKVHTRERVFGVVETPHSHYIAHDFKFPINDRSKYPTDLHPYAAMKVKTEKYLASVALKNPISIVALRLEGIDGPIEYNGWVISKDNLVRAFELALRTDRVEGFSAINIADEGSLVDLTKAREILGY